MKQYPIALCFLALFVASCTDEKTNAAASEKERALSSLPIEMTRLNLDLPPENKVGTPVPIKLPNLDERVSGYNPEVVLPKDASNVALNKPVVSSDDFPMPDELKMITDGNKESQNYVELMGGNQWVQIDFGKVCEIYAIALWLRHDDFFAYKDVVVRLSDDPEFKSGATTVFNNDHDNSAGFGVGADKVWKESNEGKVIALETPVKARYIRVYSNGSNKNEMNAYTEIEVYGR